VLGLSLIMPAAVGIDKAIQLRREGHGQSQAA
jgi:hypothetical protein